MPVDDDDDESPDSVVSEDGGGVTPKMFVFKNIFNPNLSTFTFFADDYRTDALTATVLRVKRVTILELD